MTLDDNDLQIIANNSPNSSSETALINAAVALIFRDTEFGTEFLLIQRSFHEKDPWSGQMSFPGGKIDPVDASAKDAAIRETKEEVNLTLEDEDYIGYLGDILGFKVDGQYKAKVSCYVFKVSKDLDLKGNNEVADIVWVPMSRLSKPQYAHVFFHPLDKAREIPAVMINSNKEQVLWGLTLRMLYRFLEKVERKMTVFNQSQLQALRDLDKVSFNSHQQNT